jgi:ribosome-associated protein
LATKKLTTIVIDALEDIKARDIKLINVSKITSVFDYIAVASADSTRQTKALAKHVMDKVKEHGGWIYGIEGEQSGEWVLVDCGDIVVHIMQPAMRELYELEELWGEGSLEFPKPKPAPKPVVRVVKAVKAAPKPAAKVRKTVKGLVTAKKKTAVTPKVATKKTTGTTRKKVALTTALPKAVVKKPVAKKPAAKKSATVKAATKPTVKKAVVKTPAGKKVVAKKPVAKKATAGKTASTRRKAAAS